MDGILVVDKPQGWTSHDVVDFIRKRFGAKKVGHAGTLDPMATGVLVILVGCHTKSSNIFSADDKEYEATLTLGAETDTGDAWGRLSAQAGTFDCSAVQIENAFNQFLGEIEQRPPVYSAIKVNGKRLYKYARSGIKIEAAPRKIFIKKIDMLDVKLPEVSFRLTCSKGTYVRQLAVDVGRNLGCGAYLSKLKRTRSGKFKIEQSFGIEEIKAMNPTCLARALLCGS